MKIMIRIEKEDGKIKVFFSYDRDFIAKIKTVEGYKWHPDEGQRIFSVRI